MTDTLIQKNFNSLNSFFNMVRPGMFTTPYYMKRGEEIIPFWGFGMTKDYPDKGFFYVTGRGAGGLEPVKIRVLIQDEIYYTTNVFSLSGIINPTRESIYSYDTLTFETLSSFVDPNSEYNKKGIAKSSAKMRINKSTPYKDNKQDKDIIDIHLQSKKNYADSLSNEVTGAKNLIYFSIFDSPSYAQILDLCLQSLNKFTIQKDFDILFITDEPMKNMIQQLTVLSAFNVDFHIVDSVADAIAASAQKIRISEYPKISDYKKVLFLDVDVLCLKDIFPIFNDDLSDSLDVVMVDGGSPVSVNHSINYFKEEDLRYILHNKLRPFNAGHFLFKPSPKMLEHFANVYWLYNVWPGIYFYEQSFLNYYFNIYTKNIKFDVINKYIHIGSSIPMVTKMPPDKIIVHFIGGGDKKIDGIKNYIQQNNICL